MDLRSTSHRITRLMSGLSRKHEFSGVVYLRQGGDTVLQHAYGFADRSWNIRNRLSTHFRIASVGKMFTAVAVLQLVQAGKLDLQAQVGDSLDLPLWGGTRIPPEITVYHLLTMTSGIADWIDENSPTYAEDWINFCRNHPLYLFRQDQDYLPVFGSQPPYGSPGEKHRYNGAGFILLGLMIEKVTGMRSFEAVRKLVFEPAGMENTWFSALDEITQDTAVGYLPQRDEHNRVVGWRKNIYAVTAGPASDGGVTSTADDLAAFSLALRQNRLLSPEFTTAMLSPQVIEREGNDLGFQWHYGLGCFVLKNSTGDIVRWGHTGEEDGVSCRLWYYPQQDIDVIILGNQSACAGPASRMIQNLILE